MPKYDPKRPGGLATCWGAVLAYTLFAASVPTRLAADITLTKGRADAETTAAVVPLNEEGADARLFIATGTHQSLLAWDIRGGRIHPEAKDLTPSLRMPAPGYDTPGFDNQLTRLKDGSLILVRSGATTEPLDPKPEWWDYNGGKRGALLIWRSSDAGKTWTASKIDSAKILGGKPAWPQEFTNKDGSVTKWFGGFDRPDLYADPFNGNIYITVAVDSGSAPACAEKHAFYAMVLFVSRDGGKTWDERPIVWDRKYASSYRPLAMTSAPSGRLFLAHATWPYDPPVGFRPVVYWIDPPWKRISGAVEAWYGSQGAKGCAAVPPDKSGLPIAQPGVLAPTLSRVKSDIAADVVRLSYMALDEQGRQVQRILTVKVSRGSRASVKPVKTIVAEDPKGSILQAAFIETDRCEFKGHSDTALLYWIETSPSKGRLFARYAIVRGEKKWSEALDLSVQDGTRRYWEPHGEWMGDYMKGAFFYQGGKLNFLAQWPQSAPPDMPLHANILSLER